MRPNTYVLIPGAGGQAWYWSRLVPELERRGREVVAVDLPAEDPDAGLARYVDVVVDAVGDRRGLIVVGQSMGGLTAPLVCERVPVDLLVLVNAMVPRPGETGNEWWSATGQGEAYRACAERDGRSIAEDEANGFVESFFHDVPDDLRAEAYAMGEPAQTDTPFETPWPLDRWPAVPTHVVAGRDDRFFPLDLQRRVARDRLGLEVDEVPGGHLAALSRPVELADRLEAYRAALPT